MKRFNKAVLFVFAFSAVSGAAFAAGQSDKSMSGASSDGSAGSSSSMGGASGTGGATSFTEVDKDGNGYIDANEAASVPGLDANTADTDRDGRISRSEFEAAMKSGGATGGGSATTPGGSSGGDTSGSGSSTGSSSGSSPGGGSR